MMKYLVLRNRSYRRYYQDREIPLDTLRELVDLARLAPTGKNQQGLKYILSNQADLNRQINDCLTWAGYIKGWKSPPEGEKPSAFMVMVRDIAVGQVWPQDLGFAGMGILLGAVEKGLGGCFLMAIDKKRLREVLRLDDSYEIEAVVAIGYPREKVVLEEMNAAGDVRYWRDDNQVHHVPKRSLDDIILPAPEA